MIDHIFTSDTYYAVAGVMTGLAVIVFIVLLYVTAGYGIMYNPKWGPTLPNKAGWVVMEAPAFAAMTAIWLTAPAGVRFNAPQVVMTALFLLHYFQRAFIFPLLIKGKSRMPLSIIIMGIIFNTVNAYMIGGWLFYVGIAEYDKGWLFNPLFILGLIIFVTGMVINLQSDRIIRHLRKPGDTRHYIPHGGLYRYVTSANYFGELTEWVGYAILTWSVGGLVFVIWTFANLAPRARALHRRYISEFGDDYARLNRRYIIPFIY